MTTINIKRISPEATYPLRRDVLGQGPQPTKAGDNTPSTAHFGAYWQDKLVGVASIYHDPPPDKEDDAAWRLRGMATHPDVRGLGGGAALLRACKAYILENDGNLFWCNAREDAVGFYEKYGFRSERVYHVAGHGPCHLMLFPLTDRQE